MLENKQYEIGDIIETKDSRRYRIIYVDVYKITFVEMDTTKLNVVTCSKEKLINFINELIIIKGNDLNIVDENSLSSTVIGDYLEKKRIIRLLDEIYGPEYIKLSFKSSENTFAELAKNTFLTERTIRRVFIRYLQAGKSLYGILDKRKSSIKNNNTYKIKTGRKSQNYTGKILNQDDFDNFKEAIDYYKSKKGETTLQKAYEYMIYKHYSTIISKDGSVSVVAFSKDERPSFRQFDYHTKKYFSKEDNNRIKLGSMEYRNKRRLLTGSAETDVMMPYDVVDTVC